MKKSLLAMTALAAMLFAGCTSSDELTTLESIKQAENAPTPISFGTYMGKAGSTRTIATGTGGAIVTNENLQGKGFGVFAYYTGNKSYDNTQYWDGTSAAIADGSKIAPNFMYNQQVSYSGGWTYSPLKYWPNESSTGANIDGNNAVTSGTNGGFVSFFAYAPFVKKADAEAATEGIIGFSNNNAKGDPIVTYKVPETEGSSVDLLWGTTGANGNTILGGTQSGISHNGSANSLSYPYAILSDGASGYTLNADLTKQKNGSANTIDFAFKHALAKVGGYEGLKIVTDVDAVTGGTLSQTWSGTEVTAGTKVTVKSITITARAKTAVNGEYYTEQKGDLNLATGKWAIKGSTNASQASGTKTSYTISGSKLNTNIAEPSPWAWTGGRGVYETQQNVYASAAQETDPIIFIPGTVPELTIEIDYMVRTRDANLETGYSQVEQNITKTITFTSAVELNKYYTLVLHLGLTSVKFTASVSAWADGGSDTTGSRVDLPINVN